MKHLSAYLSISTLAILLPALATTSFDLLYLCSLVATFIASFFYSRYHHKWSKYILIVALCLPSAILLPYFAHDLGTGLQPIHVFEYIGFQVFLVLLAHLLGNIRQNKSGIKYFLGIYLPFLLMTFSFPLGRANQMVIGGIAYFFAGYYFIQWKEALTNPKDVFTFAGLSMLPILILSMPGLLTEKYHSALPVAICSICLFIIGGFFRSSRRRFPLHLAMICTLLIPFSRLIIPNILSAKNQCTIQSKQKVEYLEFYSLEGDCWSTEDAKGKYIVLDLWSTNCGICFKKFPMFEDLYESYNNKQTIFGAVHLPIYRDTEAQVTALINERLKPQYTFPIYRSQVDLYTYQSLFNIEGVPQILVIDKNSEVTYLGFGDCGDHIIANNLCNYLEGLLN